MMMTMMISHSGVVFVVIFFCNRVLISGILYLRLLTSQVLRPDFKAAAIDGTD